MMFTCHPFKFFLEGRAVLFYFLFLTAYFLFLTTRQCGSSCIYNRVIFTKRPHCALLDQQQQEKKIYHIKDMVSFERSGAKNETFWRVTVTPPNYVCSWDYLQSGLLTENDSQTKRWKEIQIGELIERQKKKHFFAVYWVVMNKRSHDSNKLALISVSSVGINFDLMLTS